MKHPEVFTVPILMLADYFLTVTGAIWKERKYDDHFKTPTYELNPALEKQVATKQWWNPRHVVMTTVLTAALLWMAESAGLPEPFVQGMLAAVTAVFGVLVGRHVCNLLVFAYLQHRPEEVSGQVVMTHSFAMVSSLCQCFTVLVPLVLLALLSATPSTIGALAGIVLLFVAHWEWTRKRKKRDALAHLAGPQEKAT